MNTTKTYPDVLTVTKSVTPLYTLSPIDIGTPWVESLTSYITRIADAHCVTVGTLISKIIIPKLNKPYLENLAQNGGTRLYHRSHAINGLGEMNQSWAEILIRLTGQPTVRELSWQKWSGILPDRLLLKPTRSWCPVCFQGQLDEGRVVYEPLLWTANPATTCIIHKTVLVNSCPHCHQKMSVLERNTQPGRCAKCGAWLGVKSVVMDGSQTTLHISQQVGHLLEMSSEDITCTIPSLLNAYITSMTDPNVASAARQLGFSKTTLWGWAKGANLPTLPQAILLGDRLGIDLIDLYKHNLNKLCPITNLVDTRRVPRPKRFQTKRHNHDFTSIEHDLILAVQRMPPSSLTRVAADLGVDRRLLYNHFPDLCKKLSENYKTLVRKRSNVRQKELLYAVRRATTELFQQGIYPSRRKVEAHLFQPGALRESLAQQEWVQTKKSLYSSTKVPMNRQNFPFK